MNTAIEYDDNDAIPYSSLSALREAHMLLLKSYRSDEPNGAFAEIEAFLRQAKATGALLDSENDRTVSQSLMDYWVTVLYRAKRTPPEATLAEFDPSLAPTLDDSLCPYVGLNAFQEEHKEAFFGRQSLVDQMVGLVQETHFLFIVGPSGSGKSSLVLAGLLPLLRKGAIPGGENWRYFARMVPGSNPLKRLATIIRPNDSRSSEWVAEQVQEMRRNPNHLRTLLSTANVLSVIVVDQFEELFTLCADDAVRQAFVDNLVSVAREPNSPGTIILTMRSDFETQIVRFPELTRFVERGQLRATPLTATDLHDAIEQPARRIGLKFEDGIVQELVRDILGEAAGLPLLQFALLRLWKAREKNRVTWGAYKKLGSARLALGRAADELYGNLMIEDQRAARGIFLRLVRPGELTNEFTSNRVRREALYREGVASDRIDRVLEKLVAAGLLRLTKGDQPPSDQVEVAHEALVRNWPMLIDWLDDERTKLRQRLRLTTAAEQWIDHDRDPGGLLGGSLLEEALSYKDRNRDEEEFVQASLAAVQQAEQEKEAVRQREQELERARVLAVHQRADEVARHAARTRRLAVILAIVAMAAIIFAMVARAQRKQALAEGKRAAEQAKLASDRSSELQLSNEKAEIRRKEAEAATILAKERADLLTASAKKLEAAIATAEARRKEAETATQLAKANLVGAQDAQKLAEEQRIRADAETKRATGLATQLEENIKQLSTLTKKLAEEKKEVERIDELNREATSILQQTSSTLPSGKEKLTAAVGKFSEVRSLYQKHQKREGEEDTLSNMTRAYRKLNDNDNTQKYYDLAMRLFLEDLEQQRKQMRLLSAMIPPAIGRLGDFYQAQGEATKAVALYKESLSDTEGKLVGGKLPEDETYQAITSYDLFVKRLEEVFRDQSDYDEIESLYLQVYEFKNKILKPDSFGLYVTSNDVARIYRDQKSFAEAEPYLEKALAMAEKALGRDNDTYVLESLKSLASLYRDELKFWKAEPYYERALSNLEKGSKKGNTEALAESLNDLAAIYQRVGKYDQAERLYQRSIALYQQSPERFQNKLNATQVSLAGVYRDQKNLAASEQLYNQVVASLQERSKGQDTPELAAALSELGGVIRESARYQEAEQLYQRALKTFQKDPRRFQTQIAATYIDFMMLYRAQGRTDLAAQYYARARLTIPLRNVDILLRFFAERGDYDRVRQVFDGELEYRKRVYGADSRQLLETFNQAGRFFREQRKFEEAERYYGTARDLIQRSYTPDDLILLVTSLNNLARVYRDQPKRRPEAQGLYVQALNLLEKNPKVGNTFKMIETLEDYAELLLEMGQTEKAAEVKQRAKKLLDDTFQTLK